LYTTATAAGMAKRIAELIFLLKFELAVANFLRFKDMKISNFDPNYQKY